jgi:hypothetical protein
VNLWLAATPGRRRIRGQHPADGMREDLDRIQTALDQGGVTLPKLCDAEGEPLGPLGPLAAG